MSHETGGPGDTPDEGEEDYADIDQELEPGSEREGLGTRVRQRLGNAKERYIDWHTVEEEKVDQGVAGSNISRRGFLAGAAQVGVGAFALAEATDGDGYAVNWSSGAADGPAAGGVAPPPGNETETPEGEAAGVPKDEQYAWETEEELIDNTGLCYPGEPDAYIGAISAVEVEDALEESDYMGSDPTGALNVDEVDMTLRDITANQNLYAVDVDRKQGNDGDYDLFVQLVGQEDGGLYLTRGGAQKITNMEFEETFDGYHECN